VPPVATPRAFKSSGCRVRVVTMALYSSLSLPTLICWPCLLLRPAFMMKRIPAINRPHRLCNALEENGNLAKVGSYLSSLSCHFLVMRCKAALTCSAPDGNHPHGTQVARSWNMNRILWLASTLCKDQDEVLPDTAGKLRAN